MLSIHFNGRIDRYHPVVLGDDERVVHVFGGMQLDKRIVIYPIIQAFGSDDKSGDDFSLVQSFAGVCENPCFNQIDNSIREQFSVDA
jgi:hypothetical protein